MMGYTGPSEILRDKSFGPGRGPIWVDQLGCSGTESSLLECSKLPWAKHNCNHTEDVGIRCSEAPRTEKVNLNLNEINCKTEFHVCANSLQQQKHRKQSSASHEYRG